MDGSHAKAIRGIRLLRDERRVGADQLDGRVKHNVAELPRMLDLALSLGADALHLFMLVPVGCGLEIAPAQMLPATSTSGCCTGSTSRPQTCRSI